LHGDSLRFTAPKWNLVPFWALARPQSNRPRPSDWCDEPRTGAPAAARPTDSLTRGALVNPVDAQPMSHDHR
ncbi:hypothetical protein QN416_24055, partial [Glaciimonas sp. Cout2]|uniref:hypothetical protein n=1 Tax=Glaciimonas sp. Cout2 TaxID=3048621 RepID=UPI002B230655